MCRYAKKYDGAGNAIQDEIASLKKHATVVRVLAQTQPDKTPLENKKCHLMEIQVRPQGAATVLLLRTSCIRD